MSFWDGTKWVQPTRSSGGRALPRSRVTDVVSTALMVFVLIAAVLPWGFVRAGLPSLSVSPATGAVGQRVTLEGLGFTAKSAYKLTWDGTTLDLPTVKTTARGTLRVRFVVPVTAAGAHKVGVMMAQFSASQTTAQATYTVTDARSANQSNQPNAEPSGPPSSTPFVTAAPSETASPSPVGSTGPTMVASAPPSASAAPLSATPAPNPSAPPEPTASPAVTPPVPPSPIALGAWYPGASWPQPLANITALFGRRPAIVMWYQNWAGQWSTFDAGRMTDVVSSGAMPMISWMPDDGSGQVENAQYSLRSIAAGQHDAFIRAFAAASAAWGRPYYLRWASEMNGNWFSWGSGVNGNIPQEFVAAWRHVVDVFRAEGASNVRHVWSPNVQCGGCPNYASLFPGDAYVDWIALDGYNWGSARSEWRSLASVFGASYVEITALSRRPFMIAETASAEGGDKAAWIRQGLLYDLPVQFPRARAVIWFNENKEADWRVDSSAASLAAFREVVASPAYQGWLP